MGLIVNIFCAIWLIPLEDFVFYRYEREKKCVSEDSCGYDLSDADRQKHKRQCIVKHICEFEHDGDYQSVCKDGWDRRQEFPSSQIIGSDSAKQGCKCTENKVLPDGGGLEVCDQASDGQPRDRRRGEKGKDAQGLGKASLNNARGQAKGGADKRQSYVHCGNECRVADKKGVAFHFLFSLVFI